VNVNHRRFPIPQSVRGSGFVFALR
jgi:hypothetical protein